MSSLCAGAAGLPLDDDGMIFLKKMFDDTNTRADPNAESRPSTLDAEKSDEHAKITPSINGNKDI